jgi:hypothetical protein
MKNLLLITALFLHFIAPAQQHYPLKNFYGVNVHAWDIDSVTWPSKYKAFVDAGFTFIRIYSDVYASKDLGGGYALNPDLRGFYSDSSLHSLKRDVPGLKTILCWQNQSLAVQPTWPQFSTVYRPYSLNANDTASYNEIRKDAYVLASRGGTNKNAPDYKLFNSPNWWEPRQVMYKGAGFYDVIELMNEPDMEYTFGKLSGSQVSVANSATYDGAKAADPNITVSSSGIADQSVSKFDSIAAWADKHRGGKLPFDIYQFHGYDFAWTYGMAGAVPFEYEGLNNAIQLVQHASKYNVPVFMGEYGLDKAQRSYLSAPRYSLNQYDADHSQAQLSLRKILGLARAGAMGATYYRAFYDYNQNANEGNESLFASTAFFKDINEDNKIIVRQLHCDYQKQMKDNFGEYTYKDFQRDDTTKVYRFINGPKEMLALWAVEVLSSYNDNGTTRPLLIERRVSYPLPAGTIYTPGDFGSIVQTHHSGGSITLTAKPIFFIADLTILPLRDETYYRPVPQTEKVTVNVYDEIGRLLISTVTNDIVSFKTTLPKRKVLIVHYYNEKKNKVEKLLLF